MFRELHSPAFTCTVAFINIRLHGTMNKLIMCLSTAPSRRCTNSLLLSELRVLQWLNKNFIHPFCKEIYKEIQQDLDIVEQQNPVFLDSIVIAAVAENAVVAGRVNSSRGNEVDTRSDVGKLAFILLLNHRSLERASRCLSVVDHVNHADRTIITPIN